MNDTPTNPVIAYLRDAHSIEEQALAQLRSAPQIAGDEALAGLFRDHLAETEHHERLIRERLEAVGASPSRVKDSMMAAGGKAFVLFARLQVDTPGKLVTHAYSYEHLEAAAYALLAEVAERTGDSETASIARRIEEEERRMGERLADHFTDSLEASVGDLDRDGLQDKLVSSLADAHALETQSIALLERAPNLVEDAALAELFESHRAESEGHRALIDRRLEAYGSSASRIKDAAMRLGGLNWSLFFQAQPDTTGKLAAFAYAVEHLEMAAYAHLRGVADRAGDRATIDAVDVIVADEQVAASAIEAQFLRAAVVSLGGPARL
jgi:ferritin-like metal-binding protein YciE